MASLFEADIASLKGVGPKRAELFRKLGAPTVGDLLRLYPRAYEDWRDAVPIRNTLLNEVNIVKGTVLRRPVEQRMRGGSMGFGAKVETKKERTLGELLEQVHPADLVQFGLIPEFVGRIPVLTHVDDLGEDDLVRILTEPKNALTRQYQKLFELDNVTLRFTSDALRAIAHRAIERKTGARGLRNVMESVMLDIMYQLPSMPGVKECVINDAVIEKKAPPLYIYDTEAHIAS